MADTEEYFPRGGKKPIVQYFKQSSNFLGGAEKGEKKKKKPKKNTEADDGYLSDEAAKQEDKSYIYCATGLNCTTLKAGVLVLGRIHAIHDTRVTVMLPGKTQGMAMACHISEAYNKLIEAYVQDKTESIKELPQMFRLGQYVAVKVLEVDGRKVMLSMMPQHVNGSKKHTDLHNGCLLQAAVSSVEDHGYVMDIGIPNTRAFMPKINTNPELELETGMLTWCSIKSVTPSSDNSIVTLASHLDVLQNSVQRKKNNADLLPGTAVDFVIQKALENGIEGLIFGDTTAYIQSYHADKVKGKKPALGQKVRARVLYVMPTRKTPFLSMKNIFEFTYPDLSAEKKLKEGDIIEEAQVIKITGRSIHFKLGKGCIGTMSLKRIQMDEDLTDKEIVAKSYPIGSTHKVRVLCYHLSDFLYSVTDQPSLVNERYFSLESVTAGDLVTATVQSCTDERLTASVGRLTAYVPLTHMYDAGIFVDPKRATTKKSKKKFKVGQVVKARVLYIDQAKQTLALTLKPSLLTPDLEVLSSYQQAEVGKAYTGVIKKIDDNFVLVSFFNNVVAYVKRRYVTADTAVSLTHAYHLGQIVNCTILQVNPVDRKMSGSLTTTPFWPAKKREYTKRQHQNDDLTTEPALKKKKIHHDNTDQNETENKKERNKKKDSTSESEEFDTDNAEKRKKKKGKDTEVTETETDKKSEKKKNKTNAEESDSGTGMEDTEAKKKKRDKKSSVSEESHAIEAEVYDAEVLTPEDLHLIDLSDCDTVKKYRKRVACLLRAVKSKMTKLDKIGNKLQVIEIRGLHQKNKRFHTAMHRDKLITEKRIEKLLEALKTAQDRQKELGDNGEKVEFKTKKELKRQRKESANEAAETKGDQVKSDKVKSGKVPSDKITVVENLAPVLEVPSAKEFWSASADVMTKKEEEESSSSDEEEKDQPKKKRKKLTVAEKLAKVREEEERVREMERRAIESEAQPRSSEQFERALLANPDCSQLWIAYMAFHLQATEIDKARAVGRKALNTINFREEQERLNVWLALLNCEHRFGTKESQQKTLEEAVQMNEPFKIHSKLLDILVETSKHQELTSLVDLMLRKYKQNPQNYILCGSACFKLELMDKARQVMQKAIAVLEKKEHVSVLVQFALMERTSGAPERAEALFEQVLAVYPQRVDVCSVYVDMLVKSGDADRVRQVMERMTSHKLPARKMKVLYKKWIEVEEKLGDQQQVDLIRQRAMEFIDKAKF